MKHSLFVKTLAILLCAASLMGIVGGAAGALVLVEGDLYNRTVDQMLEDNLLDTATIFADQTALSYASRELGGCPGDMTAQRFGIMPDCDYGYAILDAQGNVLESLNPELKETARVYSLSATGQYMHLVSTETESQLRAKEAENRTALLGPGVEVMDGQVIPAEGVSINQVWFHDALGNPIYEAYGDRNQCSSMYAYPNSYTTGSSDYEHEPQGRIGFLFRGADGQFLYHSFLQENEYEFQDTEVYGVMFMGHEADFYFSTSNPNGLGLLMEENGRLQFVSYPVEQMAPEETVPAAVPETIPEPIPETAPATMPEPVPETTAETAPAEIQDEETVTPAEEAEYTEEEQPEEREASDASADPEEQEEEAATEAVPAEPLPEEIAVEETVVAETAPAEPVPAEILPAETVPEVTEPVLINGKPLEFYQVNRTEFHDSNTGERTTAKFVYLPLPELTVEVYLDRDTLGDAQWYEVLRMVRQYRAYLLPAIGICLLTFAMTAVYLCTAAGRKPKTDEVRAGGVNRLPLDLYLGVDIFLGTGIIALAGYGAPILLKSDFLLGCSAVLGAAFAVCLLIVTYFFAIVAQGKTPQGFWWRNTLCVRFIFLCMRILQWLEKWLRETGLPGLGRLFRKLWDLTVCFVFWAYHLWEKASHWIIRKLSVCFRWIGGKLSRFFARIPLTWQWVICGMALFCMLLIACNTYNEFLTFLCLAASFALILYGVSCFGTLMESTKRMGKGDLDTKVDDRLLIGSFREFASDLNDLADVAMVAAQKQLKSERMKTELITNVSHDIKTPLTSIINYVDLLQKPHSAEEGAQYLEVLDRQSQRLKKLVEDLMDMSKASTGNMVVEITQVDAVESVNQALGEFADKLERAQLQPVFRHSEDSVPIMADGKLVWRVLSNLLSNAVKYAMPGTRIYLDVTHVSGKVIISLKNISREELNINAEELMERFVRGDVSRNTEGSGLGLNIAKSLMELQGGRLELVVDGDLFKVVLTLNTA